MTSQLDLLSAPAQSGLSGFTHESPNNLTAEWYTPPYIFERLGLKFDLDPASPGGAVVPWNTAHTHYTKADDGLVQPWFGKVFMNCPYGRETPKWVDRFVRHGDGVALLFARTDTRWFQALTRPEVTICFMTKRVQFIQQDGIVGKQPGCGSMLVAMGPDCTEAVRKCGLGRSWSLVG